METGCYVDGSHLSTQDFMNAVIDFAVSRFGFDSEIDWFAYNSDVAALQQDDLDDDERLDILDAMEWTMQEAIDYMNDNAPEDTYFWIHESSLYLEPADQLSLF